MDDGDWRRGALEAILEIPDLVTRCRRLAELGRLWRSAGWSLVAIGAKLEGATDGRETLVGAMVEVLPGAGPTSTGRHGRLVALDGEVATVQLSTGQAIRCARMLIVPRQEHIRRRDVRMRREWAEMQGEADASPEQIRNDNDDEWSTR